MTEKKKPVNSKGKGSGFEGQVAKKLSAALAPLTFVRTQGSGARVGGKNFATIGKMFGEDALKLFVGDVVPTNERDTSLTFRFSVETKFYKTPDGFTSLVSGTANVYKWMEESIEDAKKINKTPLLIFKWNHTAIFAALLSVDNQNDSFVAMTPKLNLKKENGPSIDVFLLDDLLPETGFWVTPSK